MHGIYLPIYTPRAADAATQQKTINTMANICVIRGKENSGKTTTCWLVYEALRKECRKEDIYLNVNPIGKMEPPFAPIQSYWCNPDYPSDFRAMLTIDGWKVGIISAGDVVDDTLMYDLQYLLSDVQYLVCCTRSQNRNGSVYQYLEHEVFQKGHTLWKEVWIARDNTLLGMPYEQLITGAEPYSKQIVEDILTAIRAKQ